MPERAAFGIRFGSWVVDMVCIVVLGMTLGPVLGGLLGAGMGAAAAGAGGSPEAAAGAALAGGLLGALFGMLAGVAIVWALYFLVEGLTGATVGKLACGLRVAGADGETPPVGLLMKRYAWKNIGFLIGVLAALAGSRGLGKLGNGVGFLVFLGCFMALGDERQALHDLLAGTAVFRKVDLDRVAAGGQAGGAGTTAGRGGSARL